MNAEWKYFAFKLKLKLSKRQWKPGLKRCEENEFCCIDSIQSVYNYIVMSNDLWKIQVYPVICKWFFFIPYIKLIIL